MMWKEYKQIKQLIRVCPKQKNILKKFWNDKDLQNICIIWEYLFKEILKHFEYQNLENNTNIETNLIYLIELMSKHHGQRAEIIKFYQRIKKQHYKYILAEMPDLEIRFLNLVMLSINK